MDFLLYDRLAVDRRRTSKPLERPAAVQEIQIDFKDDSTVPVDPLGKWQHGVETCNFVDAGTSIWLHALVREVTTTFRQHYNSERPHQGRSCRSRSPSE